MCNCTVCEYLQSEHSRASSFSYTISRVSNLFRHPIVIVFTTAMSKPRMHVQLDDSNVEPYQWGNSDRGDTDLNVDFSLIAPNVLYV